MKYNKSLDNDQNLEALAAFYDETDVSDVIDSKSIKIHRTETKRVSLNLPANLYHEATKIGRLTGTGYQNALKIAMAIGFKHLDQKLGV